jgi:hypothetical protein
MKNSDAPAVKREAEQDGRGRGVNDLSAGALIILATTCTSGSRRSMLSWSDYRRASHNKQEYREGLGGAI